MAAGGTVRPLVRCLLLGVGLAMATGVYLGWAVWQQQGPYLTARLPSALDGLAVKSVIAGSPHPPRASVDGGNVTFEDERTCRLAWVGPRPGRRWSEMKTQLIFFGKPIMQVVRTICVQRRWSMQLILNDSAEGVAYLESIVSPDKLTILFVSSRQFHHPLIQRLANSTSALVSAVRYSYKITGGKKGQLKAFRSSFSSHGCSLDDVDLMPRSFLMDDSADCKQFFKYASARPSSWWVLKSSQGYGGSGVTIHPNVSALFKQFGACMKTDDFIVQEYIGDPLLLEGKKFDVRAFLLIAGTKPYLLFHHDGYLRVAVKRFSLSEDRAVHLTNSHVQVLAGEFSPDDHFWSFSRFQSYLDQHHPNNGDFVSSKLIPFVKKTGAFILQAGIGVFGRYPSTFQLLGLDFMVTSDFQIRFIEANNYPLWPKGSQFVDEHMRETGSSMFDLLFALQSDPSQFGLMRPGQWFQSWQLVWSEAHSHCSHYHYNPCTESTTSVHPTHTE